MKTRLNATLCSALLLALFVSGCQNAEVTKEQLQESSREKIDTSRPTIDGILKYPRQYAGKSVTVQGRFSGWEGRCTTLPPKTRSDWMLESKNSCLYVSGKTPKGTSARPPAKGIGKMIIVTGRIVLDAENRPYIEVK